MLVNMTGEIFSGEAANEMSVDSMSIKNAEDVEIRELEFIRNYKETILIYFCETILTFSCLGVRCHFLYEFTWDRQGICFFRKGKNILLNGHTFPFLAWHLRRFWGGFGYSVVLLKTESLRALVLQFGWGGFTIIFIIPVEDEI